MKEKNEEKNNGGEKKMKMKITERDRGAAAVLLNLRRSIPRA